jgi:ubiquinone/menaquinone biosynthesis C-methylase UbiE
MSTKDYYEEFWDKNSTIGYEPPEWWTKENLEWHYAYFSKYIGKRVLDIGAGEGTFLNFLSQKTSKIETMIGAELSDSAIAMGNKKYPELQLQQEFVENLSFADNSFDTVFCIEVVEHLLDIDRALQEIHRVLKPGSYFCVTTTDFNWPKKTIIAALFWEKFFYPNNPHIRFFTKSTLRDICAKNKLEFVNHKWNKSYFGLMPKGQMAVFRKLV